MIYFAFAGIRWRASFGFFALLAAFLFADAGGFALAFLGAAALHELGHLLAMGLCGVRIRLIELVATGLLIHRAEGGCIGFSREAGILLAGAGANLGVAGLLYLLGTRLPALHPGALHFSAVNAALALYHLLPVGGLDGGSLLALFCGRILGCRRGAMAAGWISRCFCVIALVLLACRAAQNGPSPTALLMGALLLSSLLLSCGDS